MLENRLATRLIRIVLTIYLLAAATVTCVQLALEFSNEKNRLHAEIGHTLELIAPAIGEALWNFDDNQLDVSATSLLGNELVHSLYIYEANGDFYRGHSIHPPLTGQGPVSWSAGDNFRFPSGNHYRIEHPLISASTGRQAGYIVVFSSPGIVFQRASYTLILTVINALIKTVLLWLIAMWVLRRYLSEPLKSLTHNIDQLNPDKQDTPTAPVVLLDPALMNKQDELGTLLNSFFAMERALADKDKRLSDYHEHLEELVANRTAAMQRMNEELRNASDAKSEFLANMSHEIRTPMNGIYGVVELLKFTELSEQQSQYLGIIQSSCEALVTIINDVLDFSKIEAGKLELEKTQVNLEKLIYECSLIFAQRSLESRIPLIVDIEPGLPVHVQTDAVRVRQIVLNLLSNAFKFTERGQISVFLASFEENGVTYLKFEVQDTGIGIAEAQLNRLFKSFEQADSTISRRFGGTGLGLAISKKLASLLGGQIGVSSVEGFGSNFWFTIKATLPPDFVPVIDQQDPLYRLPARQIGVFLHPDERLHESAHRSIARLGLQHFYPANCSAGELDQSAVRHLREANLVFIAASCIPALQPETTAIISQVGRVIIVNEYHEISLDTAYFRNAREYQINTPFSTYACRLAIHALYKPKQREATATAEMPARPLRVLVAEDNPTNQLVVNRLLKKLGISATVVNNGQDAHYEATHHTPYDLILMDCEMPVMDGFRATHLIRDAEATQQRTRCIIIAVTAHALDSHKDRALQEGMDDYLVKPFSLEQLKTLLQRHGLI